LIFNAKYNAGGLEKIVHQFVKFARWLACLIAVQENDNRKGL
jgi:hypothetical protein